MKIFLDKDIIDEVYKLVYKKKPVYTKENYDDIMVEIQAMYYLLNFYGVSTNCSFSYDIFQDARMPISLELMDALVKITSNRDTHLETCTTELPYKVRNTCIRIGNFLKELLNDKDDKIEALRLLTSVIHSKESMVPTFNDEQLAEFNNCSIEDIRLVNRLYKNYNDKIEECRKDDISISLPYKVGTYLKRTANIIEHVDQVEQYIVNEDGLFAIILKDALSDHGKRIQVTINELENNWVRANNRIIEFETAKHRVLKK